MKMNKGKVKALAAQHSKAGDATITMHHALGTDIDEGMTTLLRMLTYNRPADSKSEELFIAKYIDTIPGMQSDLHGNRYIVVGDGTSDVMFSCHTDTVHQHSGWQSICVDQDWTVRLHAESQSNCLGADDCAGIWLCAELIALGIAGLYVFHRAEEHGGIGSSWIADYAPHMLEGIKYCISFDRKGSTSIITHQSTDRTASDEFADSLADALSMDMVKDTTGSFTDSMTYAQYCLIAECTNLSVGYEHEHTMRESLNLHVLYTLRNAFALHWDESKLVCVRDPQSFGNEYRTWEPVSFSQDDAWHMYAAEDTEDDMAYVISKYPEAAAALLKDYGITSDEVLEYAHTMYKNTA